MLSKQNYYYWDNKLSLWLFYIEPETFYTLSRTECRQEVMAVGRDDANTQLTKEEQKARIRQKYRGRTSDDIVVIPGKVQTDIFSTDDPKRVAVYARVSTDSVQQTTSYELQKNYYEDQVKQHPNWTLVSIYADEGISGTSLRHRDSFNRMLEDCRAGKIDLILTKSVSRFARNIVDCISLIRELAALRPPVGVFFESEHLFTLNDSTEMSLSFIATMAQEESHVKSTIMNASIEMRFGREIFLTPKLLGYDHDEDGNLVINENEARIVRLIFFLYLYGYTCKDIAQMLMNLECRTKKGNITWSASTVLQILRNERHCGALLARKTFTPSYLDHKSRKNTGERTQYYKKEHHEGIISYDDFIAVQHMIDNAKYGNKAILPQLQVIADGALKGFVQVNPRWAGFSAAEYEVASESVYEGDYQATSSDSVEAKTGEFDMRGFEVVRAQFISANNRPTVSFATDTVKFGIECIRKLEGTQYVELLIHPHEKLLAVRKSNKQNKAAVRWSKAMEDGSFAPRPVAGTAFLPILFELFGWSRDCRYRIFGVRKQRGSDSVLLFDMHDTEIFIPKKILESNNTERTETETEFGFRPISAAQRSIIGYPQQWGSRFGSDYYSHTQASQLAIIDNQGEWRIYEEPQTIPSDTKLNVTSPAELEKHIESLVQELKEEKERGIAALER